MVWLIRQIIFWGSAALVLGIDSRMRKAKRDADPQNPDLTDKSIGPWLIVAAVVGSLVFPFYFYSTRKSWLAAGLGLVMAVAFWFAVTFVTAFVVTLLATVLHISVE